MMAMSARDVNPRFRITTWPEERLPFPDREVPPLTLTDGGAFVIDVSQAVLGRPDRRDGESYLELANLDLRDEQAVLAFARVHGPMGACWHPPKPWEWEEAEWGETNVVPGYDSADYNGLTDHPGFQNLVLPSLRDAEPLRSEVPSGYVETIEDFRWAATCIRDLTRAWRFVSEGVQPGGWECPIWKFDDPFELDRWDGLDRPPDTPGSAAKLLSEYIGDGLAPFHPQVLADWWIDDRWVNESRPAPYHTSPPLYFICCLELYNHIVERAEYKTCANEACPRMFVRQQGRSEHGQHRTHGVMYCSRECARAQAQRNYRRRKRTETTEEA